MTDYTARFTDLSGYGSESASFDTKAKATAWARRTATQLWGRGKFYPAKLLGDCDRVQLRLIPKGSMTGSVSVYRDS